MSEVKHPPVATVIGDLVGSRGSGDRAALHARLSDLLAEVGERFSPTVAPWITAGDEFQACFASVGEALRATLWLRLELLPAADLRHGIGWGTVTVLSPTPRVEDGPGWWAARAAIEHVHAEAARSPLRYLRTAYRRSEEPGAATGPDPAAVDAALVCRDHLVGSLAMSTSERPLRLLRGALAGRTQAELAADEGVSASAVSQRFRADGIGAIVAADALLGEVR